MDDKLSIKKYCQQVNSSTSHQTILSTVQHKIFSTSQHKILPTLHQVNNKYFQLASNINCQEVNTRYGWPELSKHCWHKILSI